MLAKTAPKRVKKHGKENAQTNANKFVIELKIYLALKTSYITCKL